MKTFNNPSMCYMGPGGSPPTPYEPTPYATTQLIQSNIMSKNSGAGPGDKRWKPQQPKPPELPSQLQFNVMEQNRLNKGECLKQYIISYTLVVPFCLFFKYICWNLLLLHPQIITEVVKFVCLPPFPITRQMSTALQGPTTAPTEPATALRVWCKRTHNHSNHVDGHGWH